MEISVRIGEEKISFTEDNCLVYRFRHHSELDHVYYQTEDRAFYMFDTPQLCNAVQSAGGTVIIANDPSDLDFDAYARYQMQQLEEEMEL